MRYALLAVIALALLGVAALSREGIPDDHAHSEVPPHDHAEDDSDDDRNRPPAQSTGADPSGAAAEAPDRDAPAQATAAQTPVQPAPQRDGPRTYRDWARAVYLDLAARLNRTAPDDLDQRLLWLVAWAVLEEPAGQGASDNPLNTTRAEDCDERDFNAVGVRNYGDFECGVAAVGDTLLDRDGLPRARFGYDAIVAAMFDAEATFDDFAAAVHDSSWCAGCAGGRYRPSLANAAALSAYADTPIPTGSGD